MTINKNGYRSHSCGELRKKDIGKEVVLSGWVNSRRDHGGLIFIDLRDKYGLAQVIFDPKIDTEAHAAAEKVRPEWCLKVEGKVRARGKGLENSNLDTGDVEIEVYKLEVLNESETPPFEIEDESRTNEELRLRYRYLDLRRKPMQKMLALRDELIFFIRERMRKLGFVEVQTPIMANSSPEGSRDYLVPSRVHPGKFYALPQAPQQFKQILMCAGVDKYFQIAPIFRDEDPRADRLVGDFYQFDLEMSFVTQEDIFDVVEDVYEAITKDIGKKMGKKTGYGFEASEIVQNNKGQAWKNGDSWPRITYRDAMTRFGSDKPDLRFDLAIYSVQEELLGTEFNIFKKAIEDPEMVVHALRVPGGDRISRREIDRLTELALENHAKGLAWLRVGEDVGPVANNVEADLIKKVEKALGAGKGDLIFFGADKWEVVCKSLGAVRKEIGQNILKLADPDLIAWAWVTDFPFFERNDEGGVDFCHNPFSMPIGGLEALNDLDPMDVRAYQYDFVANGYEICSGAIRNHDPRVLERAFEIVGHSKENIEKSFGHMIQAFKFGAPPHGGAAPGIDRTLMLLLGTENVRDTIAFPKASSGVDLMMGSPAEVTEQQLEDLGLKIIKK